MPGLTPAQSDHVQTMRPDDRDAYIEGCRKWNANRPQAGRQVWMGTQEERDRANERMMREHRLGRWHW